MDISIFKILPFPLYDQTWNIGDFGRLCINIQMEQV